MSPCTNSPCMTTLGQQLMAPNYSFSVLQKAASVVWPSEMSLSHKWVVPTGIFFILNFIPLIENEKFWHINTSYDYFCLAPGWFLRSFNYLGQEFVLKSTCSWEKGRERVSGGKVKLMFHREAREGHFFPTGCLLWSGLMWCWRDRDVRMN